MYEYVRHVFGAKCSPTCANHALQTCSNDHASDYPFVQRLVHENFYMDDFYLSTDTISVEHRALSPAGIPHAKQRILGIPWTLQNDTVSANVSKLSELKELPPTQCTLLHIISSQFDPLGITAPIVIRLRKIANDDLPEYNAFV